MPRDVDDEWRSAHSAPRTLGETSHGSPSVTTTASAPSTRQDWLLFILLGFLWGSSYLFIKIGVEAGLQPFTLVTLRLLVGFALLATVVAAAREQLPRSLRTYGHLVVMAAFSVAIPFSLITWAEQSIDSTLASVLNGSVPLFVIVIAAIFLRDEPITINRVAGLAVGFLGVAILVGFDPAALASGDLAAEGWRSSARRSRTRSARSTLGAWFTACGR